MRQPTGIVDKFLYPIQVAAEAHRGVRTIGKYQWMADLNSTDLNLLIEELQIETERVLTEFFRDNRIELLDSFESWLADRAQQEKGNVNPIDTIEPESLA